MTNVRVDTCTCIVMRGLAHHLSCEIVAHAGPIVIRQTIYRLRLH